MKRFLTLLFALSAYLANGQDYRRIVIASPSGSSGAYEVRAPRNLQKFPLTTSGTSSYTAALASGAFSLTVINTGCVIASGTPPPLTAPTCAPSLPVLASNSSLISRYSYSSANGGTLQIRAAGDASAQLKIETVSGQVLTLSNSQNPTIPYNTFVGYGASGDSSYPYDWTLWGVPQVPIRVSMKTSGNPDAIVFTPVAGTSQALTRVSGGTDPPTSTSTAAPSFANAFRYSHSGSTLTIEIDGNVGDLSFNTVPSSNTSWGNPDNITINSGQFYSYGEHLENAPWSKRWQVNMPAGAQYSLTARQAGNTSNTFTTTLTPQANASNVVFVGMGSATNPVTPSAYDRVYVLGNSITDNGNGRGLDASADNKDYLHLLTQRILSVNANAVVRTQKDFSGGIVTDGPYWEAHHFEMDGGLTRFNNAAAWQPTTILIRLGENVPNAGNDFAAHYLQLVQYLKAQAPSAKVVVTNSGWSGKDDVNNAIQTLAAQQNWIWANMQGISGFTSGAQNHPNDTGMQGISDRIWAAIVNNTTTTAPNTGTTAVAGTLDSQGFLVYEDQQWTGADEKVLENGEILMKFKRSVGACPTWAALKSNGVNVVNDVQVSPNGTTISDKGVQWQVSPYAYPTGEQPLTIAGRTETGTGDNPVQGGSTAPYFGASPVEKSAIINTSDRGPVACFRVRGNIWNFPSTPGHMPMDIEWWFKPNGVICYKVRLTIEPRPSNWSGTQKFQAISQELLCLYNIADFNNHIVRINGSEVNLRNGVPLGSQSNDYFTSECFAGTYKPDRSAGVLYYTPRNSIFKSWQKGAEQGQWPDDNSAYINASVKRTYDIAGTQTIDNGYIILGSQSQAMAALAGLEPIDQSFDFDFTSLNNQWWNEDSRVMRDSGGGLKWFCGDEKTDNGQTNTFGRFLSPARAWQASQFPKVEFTMAVSGVNRLLLKWAKPGHFGQYEYSSEVVVNGDGTERVYQFDLSNLPNWNGTITYLGLQATVPGTPSAYAIMKRARKVNAVGDWQTLILLSIMAGTALRRRTKVMAVRQQKSTPRLRLGVGSLASALLVFALFSCQSPPAGRTSQPAADATRVLISDEGTIEADTTVMLGRPGEWTMYGTSSGKIRLDSLYETNYDPCHCGSVSDSLKTH